MKVVVASVLLAACGASAPPAARETAAPRPQSAALDQPPPPDVLVLDVRAVRWRCTIKYPTGFETSELFVPVGRPIQLVVSTPELPGEDTKIEVSVDPAGVKKPVVKDHPVEIDFRIDKPGEYTWKCPTITPPPAPPGAQDTAAAREQRNPVKPLHAITAADYDAMIAAENPTDPAELLALGKKLYEKKACNACHTIDGTPRVGPSWKGIWGTKVTLADNSTATVDVAYVRRSILEPQAFARPGYPPSMPSFKGNIRDVEIAALTAFIRSLADKP